MIFYDPWTCLIILLFALALDRWLGEPYVYHPQVGFGRLAVWLETRVHREGIAVARQYWGGVLATLLLLLPVLFLVAWLDSKVVVGAVTDILVLYLALGMGRLREDGGSVLSAIEAGDLDTAREELAVMSRRNTAGMDAADLHRAGVETVLESGNTSVLGSLFWFLLLGGVGAVVHRLINLLDVLWAGNPEFDNPFGRFANRLASLMNRPAAWLCVLLYALAGRSRRAIVTARRQAGVWESRNAGLVLAAGADALQLSLGGGVAFAEGAAAQPRLGRGRAPAAQDIPRALRLVGRSVHILVWCQVLIAGGWSFA